MLPRLALMLVAMAPLSGQAETGNPDGHLNGCAACHGAEQRGFSSAHAFAAELAAGKSVQHNWTIVGMQLLDLSHVDSDMTKWYTADV